MGDKTGISWTDETWNPVKGCSRVSAGCVNCYAEVQAARIVRMGNGKPTAYDGLVKLVGAKSPEGIALLHQEPRWTGIVRFDPKVLALPLRQRKPRRIFVNSMSDLFHEKLTNEQIAAVFGVMAACPQHTFQVLTKRAKRMREWFEWALDGTARSGFYDATFLNHLTSKSGLRWEENPKWLAHCENTEDTCSDWPLPNVWLGVSVENQEAADERIPELLRTPAAVRFLSCEPLLGPVDLTRWIARVDHCGSCGAENPPQVPDRCLACGNSLISTWGDEQRKLYRDGERYTEPFRDGCELAWVIAGCESGPGARPCSVEWLRSLRDQCASAGVAFFLKQAEESVDLGADGVLDIGDDDSIAFGDGSKLKTRGPGGCRIVELPYLDGVQHAAFPESP